MEIGGKFKKLILHVPNFFSWKYHLGKKFIILEYLAWGEFQVVVEVEHDPPLLPLQHGQAQRPVIFRKININVLP